MLPKLIPLWRRYKFPFLVTKPPHFSAMGGGGGGELPPHFKISRINTDLTFFLVLNVFFLWCRRFITDGIHSPLPVNKFVGNSQKIVWYFHHFVGWSQYNLALSWVISRQSKNVKHCRNRTIFLPSDHTFPTFLKWIWNRLYFSTECLVDASVHVLVVGYSREATSAVV